MTFINDVQAAAISERFNGELKGISEALYYHIGTGISCVIIINSKIYKGFNNTAGEIAFWKSSDFIIENGSPIFEQLYSGKVLEKKIQQYLSRKGEKQTNFLDLISILEVHEDKNDILLIIEEHFKVIAMNIHNIAVLLNPQKIVLGGGVSALKNYIYPTIISELNNLINPPEFSFVNNPQNTGLSGCALYASYGMEIFFGK